MFLALPVLRLILSNFRKILRNDFDAIYSVYMEYTEYFVFRKVRIFHLSQGLTIEAMKQNFYHSIALRKTSGVNFTKLSPSEKMPAVNFINNLRTNFSYETSFRLLFSRYMYVKKRRSYEKFVRLCWWNWHQSTAFGEKVAIQFHQQLTHQILG